MVIFNIVDHKMQVFIVAIAGSRLTGQNVQAFSFNSNRSSSKAGDKTR